jgi:two-component system OmpR family response regulator
LIVLDLLMPGLSGMEVFERLRGDEKTASVPIVVLTGLEDKEFDKTALTLGADGYVTKPCEPRQLMDRIHETLKSRA